MKGENMNNKSLIQNETVFLNEVTELVQKARDTANSAVSSIIVVTYWNIGKKIVEQEQSGNDRAEYGKQVIEVLANNFSGIALYCIRRAASLSMGILGA